MVVCRVSCTGMSASRVCKIGGSPIWGVIDNLEQLFGLNQDVHRLALVPVWMELNLRFFLGLLNLRKRWRRVAIDGNLQLSENGHQGHVTSEACLQRSSSRRPKTVSLYRFGCLLCLQLTMLLESTLLTLLHSIGCSCCGLSLSLLCLCIVFLLDRLSGQPPKFWLNCLLLKQASVFPLPCRTMSAIKTTLFRYPPNKL